MREIQQLGINDMKSLAREIGREQLQMMLHFDDVAKFRGRAATSKEKIKMEDSLRKIGKVAVDNDNSVAVIIFSNKKI